MRTAALAALVLGLVMGQVLTGSPAVAAPVPRVPAELVDLSPWKLTLPTGSAGRPTEILQPRLRSYADEHFRLTERRDGIAFTAEVGGATTPGSRYPRSELREMDGADATRRASWSPTSGTHTLVMRAAVTQVPPRKPHVVAAQIHDGEDDVLQIRLEGTELSVQWDDGARRTVLDPRYRLGTPFDLAIVVDAGRIRVAHDGMWRTVVGAGGSGWYFKAGSYVQSNESRGDERGAAGEVVLYGLQVRHTR